MPLQTTGQISLLNIATEFGGTTPHEISEYYRGGARVPNTTTNNNIPTSGQISLGNFYGGSAAAAAFTWTAYILGERDRENYGASTPPVQYTVYTGPTVFPTGGTTGFTIVFELNNTSVSTHRIRVYRSGSIVATFERSTTGYQSQTLSLNLNGESFFVDSLNGDTQHTISTAANTNSVYLSSPFSRILMGDYATWTTAES